MKTFFAALIIVLISHTIHAQEFTYFLYIDEGMRFYHGKQYADAGKSFDRAFEDFNGKSTQTNFYNAACAWSLAGSNNKAFFYLQKILAGKTIKGWDDPVEFYSMLSKDSDFNNIKNDPKWTGVLSHAERNKQAFLKGIKQDIANRIKEMGESDQSIRVKLDSLRKASGLNSSGEKDLIDAMKKVDANNFNAFEEIINQYGWLGPSEIGYKNNQYLFLILQHADLTSQKKYLPLFRKSCKAGKVLPKDLAYLEDRINMREGKMQQYGSQTVIDKVSKKFVIFPIEDVDHVDQRRASVGLESLKAYVKSSFNIDFNLQQYKEELPALQNKYIK
ncbi:DUF6624 domain-containing protein [Chryseobacterium sp. MHB01]|uniref:DUF6624 domain-containing protein n=1 Tax=Chryseobacterium sp. MHB01 TaxID=3109433 RepID=UPI002AFEF843|nr:DUF6624 domain-containing protein [Chryseobacterium sp. MHB01]MEA1849943.1 DUF6624 domain-containing protein [Chryseobacterium sp. MHB01]